MTERAQIPARFQTATGRRNWCAASVVLLLAAGAGPGTAWAQPHHHRRDKEDAKRQVERLEEDWRVAQLNGDVETMDRLLSDDFVGITMSGQVVTKMQQMDRMRNRALVLKKIDLDDVKVKLTGPTAVVTSRAQVEGTNAGEKMQGTYRYTRVYTRLPGGTWKITNFEATRVGGPEIARVHAEAQGPGPIASKAIPGGAKLQ
ncbi:MAG TPA: nuclear transport factor 2 family protein [Acidobacteriaceae bacterium]|nr:nuclear transport factor 2 family protein [Acidobacteriaceae bacterium]